METAPCTNVLVTAVELEPGRGDGTLTLTVAHADGTPHRYALITNDPAAEVTADGKRVGPVQLLAYLAVHRVRVSVRGKFKADFVRSPY